MVALRWRFSEVEVEVRVRTLANWSVQKQAQQLTQWAAPDRGQRSLPLASWRVDSHGWVLIPQPWGSQRQLW